MELYSTLPRYFSVKQSFLDLKIIVVVNAVIPNPCLSLVKEGFALAAARSKQTDGLAKPPMFYLKFAGNILHLLCQIPCGQCFG